MTHFRARLAATLLCAAAGFAIARYWPAAEMRPGQPATIPAPARSAFPAHSTDATVPATPTALASAPLTPAGAEWMSLQGEPRLAAFREYVEGVNSADWPEFFDTHWQEDLLRDALIDGRIAVDPAGLWKRIVREKDAALLERVGRRLFEAWATRDAPAAFAATARIGFPQVRDPLRSLVVEIELARDLAAGLVLAAGFGPLTTSEHVATAWLERNPVAALHGLTALPGGRDSFRTHYLNAAARIVDQREPLAFVEWLEARPRLSEYGLSSSTFTAAPAVDPSRMLAALLNLPPGYARDQTLGSFIAGAAPHFTAAELIDATDRHLKGWQQNSALAQAASTVAATEPAKAAEFLAAVRSSQWAIVAAAPVTRGMATTDWSAAREWAGNLPDAPVRRAAWRELSGSIPPDRPGEFASTVAALPEEELSDRLLANVHRALVAQSAAAAENWLASLPADRADWAREAAK